MKQITFFCLLFCLVIQSKAQHDLDSLYNSSPTFKAAFDKAQENKSIFRNDAPLFSMTLEADFKSLTENRDSSSYTKAKMTVDYNDTITYTTKLKIKPRGVMRREKCTYPPLKLNFSKKKILFKELQQFDKIKLVQSCKDGQNFQEYLVSEYLVYKMYNLFTDMSFRVRLFKIKFVDTGGLYPIEEQFAFIIEPFEQMAARVNMNAVKDEVSGVLEDETNWNQAALVDVFQYMIGNCDWAIANGHNMKLLNSKDPMDKLPYSVPYDFDYSGFVNAPYAKPPRILPISRVTERFYMGACRPKKELKKTFSLFIEKQDEIFDLIQEFPHLQPAIKNRLVYFTSFFYAMIEEDEYFKEFKTLCK